MSKTTPPAPVRQGARLQVVASTRQRRKIEPQVPSIRAGIFGQWLNGVLETQLADRYGCAVPFINAVLRSEARAMREQLREARMERAA